jgi:tripartite-type tricarboxylate transporter receptor subunit TctC
MRPPPFTASADRQSTGQNNAPNRPIIQEEFMYAVRLLFAVLALISSPLAVPTAAASDYPSRPIRLIVPYAPGGSADAVARLVAPGLAERLGQSVVIDNRSGAAGSIGTEAVIRAPADGYTLLLHTSILAIDPSFKPNLRYDVQRDLAPVSMLVTGAYLVVVNPALPVRSVPELIAHAKARPGALAYGSHGIGSSTQLAMELFRIAAGQLELRHVPFRTAAQLVTSLVSNDIQVAFDTVPGSRELALNGQLRAIAVSGPSRTAAMPEVPTIAEAAIPGFEASSWHGLFAPRGTDGAIIHRAGAAAAAMLANPDLQAKLRHIGMEPAPNTPEQFAARLAADIATWGQVIRQANIQPEG